MGQEAGRARLTSHTSLHSPSESEPRRCPPRMSGSDEMLHTGNLEVESTRPETGKLVVAASFVVQLGVRPLIRLFD